MEGINDWKRNEGFVPEGGQNPETRIPADKEASGAPAQPDGKILRRIFVAFPRHTDLSKWRPPLLRGAVYCSFPQPETAGFPVAHKASQRNLTTGETFSSRMVSVMVLLTTVVAAIGLLRMVISGFELPVYSSAFQFRQHGWENGSGPSPLDAVQSEYQHALTKEMVKAADTVQGNAVEPVSEGPWFKSKKIKVTANTLTSTLGSGIHNLRLKIFNGTRQFLDRVTVEVDFLQANGKLIKSERFSALKVGPQQAQTIKIPEGMPGVKVQYRICEVRSRNGAAFLQRI